MRTPILLLFTILSLARGSSAQPSAIPPLDKSPLDISYLPANFPILKVQGKTKEPPLARVIYSRPFKGSRAILGGIIETGAVWRMGANEATELELFRDATIEGQRLRKGRYTIYLVPGAQEWTFVVNRETDTWGAFKYDAAKDVLRVGIPLERTQERCENFSLFFEKSETVAHLVVRWDDFVLKVPFTF